MSRKGHFLLAAAVLAPLGVGAVLGYVLTERGSQPSFVDNLVFIPTVVGKPERQAIATIEAAGLKPEMRYEHGQGRTHSAIGRVIAQQQPSARFTSKGNSIVMIVARR